MARDSLRLLCLSHLGLAIALVSTGTILVEAAGGNSGTNCRGDEAVHCENATWPTWLICLTVILIVLGLWATMQCLARCKFVECILGQVCGCPPCCLTIKDMCDYICWGPCSLSTFYAEKKAGRECQGMQHDLIYERNLNVRNQPPKVEDALGLWRAQNERCAVCRVRRGDGEWACCLSGRVRRGSVCKHKGFCLKCSSGEAKAKLAAVQQKAKECRELGHAMTIQSRGEEFDPGFGETCAKTGNVTVRCDMCRKRVWGKFGLGGNRYCKTCKVAICKECTDSEDVEAGPARVGAAWAPPQDDSLAIR